MKRFAALVLLAGAVLLATMTGCRLDIFRRGALFRQPATVIAPQPDPCAPAATVDPCNPSVVVPSPTPSVAPSTTGFAPAVP
ncbi:MAG: hypothetical protein NZ899_14585 [Thermoguttaceae bacterium]|nr:hypothetical protein [Thermoguttaceae bacterium]MDW8080188.1 hypothetical protein [Thermoguttaceae bacterium]